MLRSPRQLFVVLFALSCTIAYSQKNTAYKIPFVLTQYNNIIIPAMLNGTDTLHLMFHTAANDITLIGRQKMSVIGGEVLKRFNIVIDAERSFIYVRPNQLMKTTWGANG